MTEAEKRAARAKRFGIPQNEEAKKLAERAKKFGLESKDTVVKGLDSALPERKAKRGREGREEGRAAKRQTPDRRTGPKGKGERAAGGERKKESVVLVVGRRRRVLVVRQERERSLMIRSRGRRWKRERRNSGSLCLLDPPFP